MRILKNFSLYFLANALNGLVPFLLLPVISRYLSPEEYGIVGVFQAMTFFSLPLVSLAMHQAFFRNAFKQDSIDLAEYLGTLLMLIGVSTSFFLVLSWLGRYALEDLTGLPAFWVPLVVVYALMEFLIQVVLHYWLYREKPLYFGLFRVSLTLLNLSASLFLIVERGYGHDGRLAGWLGAWCVFGVLAIGILLWKGLVRWRWNRSYARQALHYSLPLLPHMLGGVVLFMGSRVLLKKLGGLEEAGIFTTAYQLGYIVGFVQDAFHKAYVPWVYRQLADQTNQRQIVRLSYAYTAALLAMAGGLWLASLWVFPLMLEASYHPALPMVAVLGLGFALNGTYKIFSAFIFFNEKTKLLMVSTSGAALLNLGLAVVLYRQWGVMGVAWAFCLAWVPVVVFTFIQAKRLEPLPWFQPEIGKYLKQKWPF